jgi:hypothetical protein
MQTVTELLTQRYQPIITALIQAVNAHNRVMSAFLFPLFGKLIRISHLRVLALVSRLLAGTYRRPRQRTTPGITPRTPPTKPRTPTPPDEILPAAWMWLPRLLPARVAPAAATFRADLQHVLSEPAMAELFVAAPALRTHLRPLCRAFGVTLPGDPAPPPDPEPLPPDHVPAPPIRPVPEPVERVSPDMWWMTLPYFARVKIGI